MNSGITGKPECYPVLKDGAEKFEETGTICEFIICIRENQTDVEARIQIVI